jgi:Ran GTPase-activating protein (RanGAP) involved in mRNA processing and transport
MYCVNLSILDISNTFFEREEKEVIKSLITVTKVVEPMNLHELNVSNNLLSQKSILVVCKYLKNNESLKILNFNNCSIGPTGTALLAKTLKYDRKAMARKAAQNPTIVMKKPIRLWELHVGGNYFGDDASADMAEMLEQMDYLETLDISTNNIKHGFRAILPSLKKISKSLKSLSISGN